jgi:hypothetical protein
VLEAGREAAPRLRTLLAGHRSRPVRAETIATSIAAWLEQDPDPQTRQRTAALLTAAEGRHERRLSNSWTPSPAAGVRHGGVCGERSARSEPDESRGGRPSRGRAAAYLIDHGQAADG